jgi:hypothetical protein
MGVLIGLIHGGGCHQKFGIVYVPYASIEVQHINGEWNKYVFEVDGGADITVMRYQHRKDLGIKIGLQARKETLKGVGGREDEYHIQPVNMGFGKKVITNIPVGFAPKKTFMPLLGRLEIFNKFGIYFNPWNRHTVFPDRP